MGAKYAPVQDEEPRIPLHDLSKDGNKYASVPTRIDDFNDPDENEQLSQSTNVFTNTESQHPLPPVDIGSSTKLQCLGVIVLGATCCLACIIFSIHSWTNSPELRGYPIVALPRGLSGEASSFIANIILTQCLEGLAYVHSISLRWALLKENRLVFNTNIRLFTCSRLSRPNSWYINAISAALLIICYGSTSILVIPGMHPEHEGDEIRTYLNLIALLTLGLALLGQTLLAVWCYWDNLRDIPSWSSNPLNTTVTMLSKEMVHHREGRCMQSLQESGMAETQMVPRPRQPSQWQASTSAKRANIFTWILVGLALIWWLAIILLARSNMRNAIKNVLAGTSNATWYFSWNWSSIANPAVAKMYDKTYYNAVCFSLDPSQQGRPTRLSFSTDLVISFLFVCAIQGLQTMGLHCAELSINLSRDEDIWRSLDAQQRSGTKNKVLETPPFWAALFSWKSNMLTIFKSLLHWLLGQSLQPALTIETTNTLDPRTLSVWFTMIFARLFVYVICTMVFASAITFLTVVKPKGPQPATYGHIQTIADLVDDWTLDKNGRFWWGDKGYKGGVRHAGMSCQRKDLGPIQMDALYAS